MNSLVLVSVLLAASPAFAQQNAPASDPPARPALEKGVFHDPWDVMPVTIPYKNRSDAIKDSARPGQPSPLNPSCEGMTGDACARAAVQPRA